MDDLPRAVFTSRYLGGAPMLSACVSTAGIGASVTSKLFASSTIGPITMIAKISAHLVRSLAAGGTS